MKNKYELANILYKDYVILIYKKNKLYYYDNDKLCNLKKLNQLRKLHINYLIIDNLDIYKKEYKDNKYLEYYLKDNLNNILNNMLLNWKGMK